MSKIFRCLSYRTIYCLNGKGPFVRACFSDFFRFGEKRMENTYQIFLDPTQESHSNNHSNFSPFSKEFIRSFVKLGLKLVGKDKETSVKVTEVEYNRRTFNTVEFSVKGHKLYHMFMLAWTRQLYEFPYNLTVYEAKEFLKTFRKDPEVRFTSYINLLTVINFTIGKIGEDRTLDSNFALHSLISPNGFSVIFRKNECIKKCLELLIGDEKSYPTLNSVFKEQTAKNAIPRRDYQVIRKEYSVMLPDDLDEFLNDNQSREMRFKVYRKRLIRLNKKFYN